MIWALTGFLHQLSIFAFINSHKGAMWRGLLLSMFMIKLLVPEQISSPTLFKHSMNIYWPIMKSKLANNEYSLYSM